MEAYGRKIRRAAPGIAAVLLLQSVCGWAGEAEGTERWYRLEISGAAAGWLVERQAEQDGTVITDSDLRLRLSRGGIEVTMEMASRFVETPGGQPLEVTTRQKLGATAVEVEYRFVEGAILAEHRQGTTVRRERLPAPEESWLPPARLEREIRRRIAGGEESFSLRTLDPLVGVQPIEISWKLEERDVALRSGKEVTKTSRWRESQSLTPGLDSVLFLDASGLMVRQETPFMGMSMTFQLTDREGAIAEAGAPELLIRTFVYPDRRIERPRASRRAVYGVRSVDGEVPYLPTIGDQAVEVTEGRAVVTVELGSSPELAAGEVDTGAYLKVSTFLNHQDPRIRGLVAEALAEAPAGRRQRAEALRAFVAGYLQEADLDTLFATASEVAERRRGDCTEHSVLLSALLRGAGIPSRVVMGLVYVESFVGETALFGYHMWSQAWVDSRWLDLDATLPSRFDAAHIALASSALNDDGPMLEMARVAPLIGRLDIDVVEVAY